MRRRWSLAMNILTVTPWLLWRGATMPVRALWMGYGLLWWAFDDQAVLRPTSRASERVNAPVNEKLRRAAVPTGDAPPGTPPAGSVRGAGQGHAFEVVDSRPVPPRPKPRPVGALRTGFVATLAASAGLSVVSIALVGAGVVPGVSGLFLWMLATIGTATGSILLVRRREQRLEAERLRRTQTPLGRAKASVAVAANAAAFRAKACSRIVRASCVAGYAAAPDAVQRLRRGVAKAWQTRVTPAIKTSA